MPWCFTDLKKKNATLLLRKEISGHIVIIFCMYTWQWTDTNKFPGASRILEQRPV